MREATTDPDRELERLARDLSASATVLVGPAPLLRELLVVAIDDAGQSLSDLCTALLRGEGTGADVRAALVGLDDLLELLAAAEDSPSR